MSIRNQGTAGLYFELLRGQLERRKIDCDFLEGDRAFDHCVVKLTSRKAPGVVAILKYDNIGVEPRIATLRTSTTGEAEVGHGESEVSLELAGSRRDDVGKILAFIKTHFC